MPDPTTITLIPSSVVLNTGAEQVFVAVATPPIAGVSSVANATSITWNLSPSIGTIDQDGKYQAPGELSEDAAVKVTAIDSASGNQAEATISVVSPGWRGLGVAWLGIYILLVFFTIFLLMRLWPIESLNPESAKIARLEAQATLTQTQAINDHKSSTSTDTHSAEPPAGQKPTTSPSGSTRGSSGGSATTVPATPTPSPSAPAAAMQPDARTELTKQQQASVEHAEENLKQKENAEESANSTTVQTSIGKIYRELDLLLIVVLAGMLGAFLHLAQSFSDFTGNRSLKSSWLWWYVMRPFIGGGLALVFYAALRGGLVSIVPASNTSTANLNTSGMVALCALVGLFSKAATSKLGEVFDTLFRTDAAGKNKDKVDNKPQPPQQSGSSGPNNPTLNSQP